MFQSKVENEVKSYVTEGLPNGSTTLNKNDHFDDHYFMIQCILSNDYNVPDDWTLLHIASSKGYLEAVRILLQSADTNALALTNDGMSALCIAAESGYADVVSYLIPYIDVNLKTNSGWSALDYASKCGHLDVVKVLMDSGNTDSSLSLFLAASQGHADIVSYLMKYNDVAKPLDDGWTALHGAAYFGRLDVAKVILNSSYADAHVLANIKADDGMLAIHWALEEGHTDLTSYLMKFTNFYARENEAEAGRLLFIAAENGFLNFVKTLLSANQTGNLNFTLDGASAIFVAAQNGHAEVVSYLVPYSDVNLKYQDGGYTALHVASMNGHLDVVKTLMNSSKIDCSILTNDGATALMIAAQKSHADIVSYLSKFIDVNVSMRGTTALHSAVAVGNLKTVKALLKSSNIDVSVVNEFGFTPLQIAVKLGRFGRAFLISKL